MAGYLDSIAKHIFDLDLGFGGEKEVGHVGVEDCLSIELKVEWGSGVEISKGTGVLVDESLKIGVLAWSFGDG